LPTILTHPAVPLAIGIGLGSRLVSRRLLAAGVVCSIVPDLDVYVQQVTTSVGHRGITHTALFALLCAVFAALVAPLLQSRRRIAFLFVLIATLSHPVLDAFTDGGAGIPFFWPLDDTRYFMPWRVIEVSPLGVTRFFSARGLSVLASELQWVWPPAFAVAALLYAWRVSCGRDRGVGQAAK
jgi:inner membrane protein